MILYSSPGENGFLLTMLQFFARVGCGNRKSTYTFTLLHYSVGVMGFMLSLENESKWATLNIVIPTCQPVFLFVLGSHIWIKNAMDPVAVMTHVHSSAYKLCMVQQDTAKGKKQSPRLLHLLYFLATVLMLLALS